VHPVIFDSIDVGVIHSAALATKGASGPLALMLIVGEGFAYPFILPHNCLSLSIFAKHLATTFVDLKGLKSDLACRLIALRKCPVG